MKGSVVFIIDDLALCVSVQRFVHLSVFFFIKDLDRFRSRFSCTVTHILYR